MSIALVVVAAVAVAALMLAGGAGIAPGRADDGSAKQAQAALPPAETGVSTRETDSVPAGSSVPGPVSPPSTLPDAIAAGWETTGVALLVTDGDALEAVVVLQPGPQGGVCLGMPADTLVKASRSFETMAGLYTSGGVEALPAALEVILGAAPVQTSSVQVEDLRQALIEHGFGDLWPAEEGRGPQQARRAAEAVLQLAGFKEAGGWDGLPLEGDASTFRQALAGFTAGITGSAWEAAVLPGETVVGDGFAYFQADVPATRRLTTENAATGDLVVAVQNGSGMVGAAEAAGELLAVLGCTLLPFSNAAGFPDVRETVVTFAPGGASAAQQISTLLGVGRIVEDASLQSNHVLVVVGEDFTHPAWTDDQSAG